MGKTKGNPPISQCGPRNKISFGGEPQNDPIYGLVKFGGVWVEGGCKGVKGRAWRRQWRLEDAGKKAGQGPPRAHALYIEKRISALKSARPGSEPGIVGGEPKIFGADRSYTGSPGNSRLTENYTENFRFPPEIFGLDRNAYVSPENFR